MIFFGRKHSEEPAVESLGVSFTEYRRTMPHSRVVVPSAEWLYDEALGDSWGKFITFRSFALMAMSKHHFLHYDLINRRPDLTEKMRADTVADETESIQLLSFSTGAMTYTVRDAGRFSFSTSKERPEKGILKIGGSSMDFLKADEEGRIKTQALLQAALPSIDVEIDDTVAFIR